MSPAQTTLEKLITNGNHQKLESYLAKHPGAISDEDFNLASQKFLDSTNHDISNRYSVLKLLTPRVSQEALATLKKQTIYPKKYAEYTEHQTNRNLLKSLDTIIEKDFIYPIKYPEKTSFVRKLLRLAPKRKAEDIHTDVEKKLPEMIEWFKSQIKKDPKFQDMSGNLIISEEQLNLLVYERISLKTGKQLHLDRLTTDSLFAQNNTNKLSTIGRIIGGSGYSDQSVLGQHIKAGFSNLVPPHFINVDALADTLRKNPTHPSFDFIQNQIITSLEQNMQASVKQLASQQAKGLERESVDTLRHLSYMDGALGKPTEYLDQLEVAQAKFYEKIFSEIKNNKHSNKNSLSEFERQGILLLKRAEQKSKSFSTKSFTPTEKQLLANFIEYSTDNKQLNSRYGKLLKKSFFPKKEKQSLEMMHKYSYKTSHIDTILDTSHKLSDIIGKYKEDPNVQIDDRNKVPLYDIGYMYKFNSHDVSNVMDLVDNAIASDKMKTYKKLSSDIPTIWEEILPPFKNTSLNDGDLVADISKKFYAATHYRRDIQTKVKDWVTSVGHVSTGFRGKTAPFVSHVDAEYEEQEISSLTPLGSEILRVSPINLIDPKVIDQIKRITQWTQDECSTYLETQYSNLSKRLHASINSEHTVINNSGAKQKAAAIASIIPFGLGGISTEKASTWANRILSQTDSGQKLGDVLAKDSNPKGDGEGEMTCSGFTAKMTVIALAELNRQLTTKMKTLDSTFQSPKEGIIKIPFGRMNLDKVTPEVLVTHLKSKNAVKEVKQQGLAQAAIRR